MVYIPNAGAYSTACSTSFNGFPPPNTVVLQHLDVMTEKLSATPLG